jgi:hypothetical protein
MDAGYARSDSVSDTQPSLIMPRIIWSRPGNPTRGVATALGLTHVQLGDAIHIIKDATGLRPGDRVIIWDDGAVTDANHDPLGNIYDEI